MTTCRRTADMLLDYLDQALNPEQARLVQQHLLACSPCERFAASYRRTTVLCRQALLKETPQAVGQRLLTYLRRETHQG